MGFVEGNLIWTLLAAFAGVPARAANPEAAKYAACVAKVSTAPDAALDMATGWRARGGGVAAQHCIALALIGLKLISGLVRDAVKSPIVGWGPI